MPLIKDFPSIAEDHSEMQERVLMVLQATGGTEPASLAPVHMDKRRHSQSADNL